MSYNNLLLHCEEKVALLTVNRPQALNALDPATIAELTRAFVELAERTDIHAVVLTGAGEKAFVAGGDIAVMQPLGALQAREVALAAQRLFNLIETAPQTVIAAVNGYALGGGCELAMACDIRIAAATARLGQPEINLGIIPGWGGTQRLARLVGRGKAKQLMLTGEMIDAATARAIGLVEEVVPQEELRDAALELARKIAAKPQQAARMIRQAVDNGLEMPLERAFAYEAELFGLCFATADQKEGMAAFLEKRPANWVHR